MQDCCRPTPAGMGILAPSKPIISGQPPAGAVPDGYVIDVENWTVLLLKPVVMPSVPVVPLFENVGVRIVGLPGRKPAS